jgi:sulfur-oxidizing protein SoxY
VKLDIPPLIDNGNAVPLTVTVESPMTQAEHVRAIHVLTERNPQPNVVSAHLGTARRARQHHDAGPARRYADRYRHCPVERRQLLGRPVPVVVTLSACLEDGLI